MEHEVIEKEITAVTVRQRDSVLLAPVMDVQTALARLKTFQEFCNNYLIEDDPEKGVEGDYGVLPGTRKKSLRKSGADKLCEIYGLYDEYEVMAKVEDWEKGLFDYEFKCILKSRRDDSVVGTGMGSCSSYESKYRWRDSQRRCPNCQQPAIIKGKDFKGDGRPTGWVCFAKKGGCNSKFKDGDPAIEAQVIGRVENPDIFDMKNTVLKMAKKRAKVDATIGVTRSSGIFTQDVEDIPQMQTSKKEPEKTADDIVIDRESSNGNGHAAGREAHVAADKAEANSASVAGAEAHLQPAVPGADCVGTGEAANFHKMFRDSLKPTLRKQAEELAHAYLRQQNIVDVLGKPSALAIKKEHFFDVREHAMEHARSLA